MGEPLDEVRDLGGVPIIVTPFVKPDRAYLIPPDYLERMAYGHTSGWLVNPWGLDRFADPAVEIERRRALNYLGSLLDKWCWEMGLDPNVTWRVPKQWENERRWVAYDLMRHEIHYGGIARSEDVFRGAVVM